MLSTENQLAENYLLITIYYHIRSLESSTEY
jgi:hypothetical protein